MNVQTIFQAGNSHAVAIPAAIMKELSLKKGQEVTIDRIPDSDAIIVRPKSSKKGTKLTDSEYLAWRKQFFEEDGKILDKLA